jgi:uncharacterized protein YqjF (DUF2071 family)
MMTLKQHPFPVVAHFERVVAVSFAFPEEILKSMVPAGLEIDTYEGLGFVTVAMVWTRGLRPAGFPAFLGQDFFLSGYRIFTRLEDDNGRRLRGLKIIRSETDKRRMVQLGNLITGYNYRRVKVRIKDEADGTHVVSTLPNGKVTLDLRFDDAKLDAALPEGSPFPDWRTARQFAGPMPFTFSPQTNDSFVVVEGSRETWKPRPVDVLNWQVSLFDETPLSDVKPILANAFAVENVDYRWERGRIVKPGGNP